MSILALEGQITQIPEVTYAAAGVAKESDFRQLRVGFAEIAERISKQLDEIASRLLGVTCVEEFDPLRSQEFASYMRLCTAFTNVALTVIDQNEFAHILQDSLVKTESKFAASAHAYLGDEDYREALFSITNLRSAQRLLPALIIHSPMNADDRCRDRELAKLYVTANVWANMHLHCLQLAIEKNQLVAQEILNRLLEGLRQSLMAYAYAREALDLRGVNQARYANALDVIWDAEDEALAKSD